MSKVSKSDHSLWEKMLLHISMAYSYIGKIYTYFSVSLYFTAIILTFNNIFDGKYIPKPEKFVDGKFENTYIKYQSIALYIYIMIIGGMIYFSINYKQKSRQAYSIWYAFSTIFGIYVLISFGFIVDNIVNSLFFNNDENLDDLDNDEKQNYFNDNEKQTLRNIFFISLFGHLLPIICDSLFRIKNKTFFEKYWSLFVSFLGFTFYCPSYILMFIIFAFCNLDDLSWGTKGNDSDKKGEIIKQKFAEQKFWFVSKWLILNIILAAFLSIMGTFKETFKGIIWIFAFFAVIMISIRCIGALLFYLKIAIRNYYYNFYKKRDILKKGYEENNKNIKEIIKMIGFSIYDKKGQQGSIIIKEQQTQAIEFESIFKAKSQFNNNQNNGIQKSTLANPQTQKKPFKQVSSIFLSDQQKQKNLAVSEEYNSDFRMCEGIEEESEVQNSENKNNGQYQKQKESLFKQQLFSKFQSNGYDIQENNKNLIFSTQELEQNSIQIPNVPSRKFNSNSQNIKQSYLVQDYQNKAAVFDNDYEESEIQEIEVEEVQYDQNNFQNQFDGDKNNYENQNYESKFSKPRILQAHSSFLSKPVVESSYANSSNQASSKFGIAFRNQNNNNRVQFSKFKKVL
ncbi:hypothetical protein PPERSA_07789 [Pseudocohnilembus persalinus]|uniref:Transmembrane protein n=1 Tax=Pseudocohnilembus persalinus TaxID=266149 RepID=A0A0V0QBZ0_PSEPJ|nr:hypothetical protein PPERSA_07789 [Pseudocohnilembus persalinus]|eukprot:KRW99712.1 hypothetical protein PPERSA_07789 [Pseudocohnilembus persalinus]